ncbi:Hypothetical predicted protein [Cloeon dipterum]|uniref:Dynamin-binding protein n=1 Tax=Cloeon dipterum TaxID=197152 RepID=A0A8S1C829_9INSE|nr:Hypothetical predicted protein [Cloeon dipterum]
MAGDVQWWQVKKEDGTEGLCPSNFLEPLNMEVHRPRQSTSSMAELEAKNLSELALSKPPVPLKPTTSRISWRPSPPSSPPPSPPKDEEDEDKQESPPRFATSAVVEATRERENIVRLPHRAPPPVQHYRTPPPPPVPQREEHPDQSEPAATASHSQVDGHAGATENEEDARKKNEEQRQNVITELVLTEKDFGRDLKITYETFNLHDPKHLEARGIDANLLFGNILEVIKVSESLLDKLILAMKGKSEDEQLIAPCFLEMAEEIRVVYTNYCTNNDNSLALLMKYADSEDIQKVFRKGIETLQMQVSCFDMSSIIIKPVQRIMKYPLILNELYKSTHEEHRDKAGLLEAVKIMSEVASYINEAKRRQDIVSRYLGDGSPSFSSRMARFSFHSVAKKSSRLGAKLSSSLGMSNTVRDELFEECARTFFSLDKHIKNFCRGVEIVLYQTKEVSLAQFHSSEAISDFFDDQTANNFEFRQAQKYISSELLTQFTTSLQKYVLEPLNAIIDLAIGPTKLIEKRNDKLADYHALLSKAEKLRDARMPEDLNLAKNTYEALNTQLLEELPAFSVLAEEIFVDCVMSYIRSRKIFSAKVAKKYLYLMELPVMAGFAREDPVGLFRVKHNLICDEMNNKLCFVSRTFKTDNFGTMRSTSNPGSTKTSPYLSVERTEDRTQSPSRKSFLLSKYPLNKVFKVTQSWTKSEVLDLSVQEGDIVAVIKQQDPMGSTERWYVDDGENKGFVAQKCLQQYLNSSPLSSGYGDAESDRIYEEVDYASTDKEEDIYEEVPEYDFYYAEFNFDPTDESTLKMQKGQVLKVLAKNDRQGNNEWWYVENRDGEHGYVPSNYLKKYTTQ